MRDVSKSYNDTQPTLSSLARVGGLASYSINESEESGGGGGVLILIIYCRQSPPHNYIPVR